MLHRYIRDTVSRLFESQGETPHVSEIVELFFRRRNTRRRVDQ